VTRVPRLCWLLLSVPFIYLAIIFWLQPPDHLGFASDKAPRLGRLVYDDFDVTAYAVRGLNAHAGNVPGLDDEPVADLDAALDDPDLTFEKRYYLEYPSATLMFFRLGWDWQPDPNAPPAVYQAQYHEVVSHLPRDDAERRVWTGFRRAAQTYLFLMAVCYAALMAVLLKGYEPGGALAGGAFLLVLPSALYFGLNRFDVLPALLTALSLACLGRRRVIASAVLLAAAMMIKVYPALLAPLVLRFLWPDRRAAGAWVAAFAATAVAIVLPPLLSWGWEPVWAPYHYQLSRGPFPPTAYGYVLPKSLGHGDRLGTMFRLGALALATLLLIVRRPAGTASLLRRGILLLIVFVTLPVFYSPQWILWLVPLLAPLARRSWPVAALAVLLDLVTYLTFPGVMGLDDTSPYLGGWKEELLARQDALLGALTYARFAALGLLAIALVWSELRREDLLVGGEGGNLLIGGHAP
jgi:hypothetical protein